MAAKPKHLTDDEIISRAWKFVNKYGPLYRLTDWSFGPITVGNLVGGTYRAKCHYDYIKRTALLMLDAQSARYDGGRYIEYLVAHELAHLLMAAMTPVTRRMHEQLAPAVVELMKPYQDEAEEGVVHLIALAAGAPEPPAEFFVQWDD